MNVKTEHYILTRFNLCLWTKDKKRNETRTEEWLRQRFNLFEKFCLPSIINQTNPNFKWIVLFDVQTPDCYKEKIKGYEAMCKQFCPCFVQPNEGRYFVKIFRNEIKKRLQNDTNRLITTYLDNDDALHKQYIDDIQEAEYKNQPTFISFVYGLQYYTELNIATRIPFFNNHFISLIEHVSDNGMFRTVYGYGSHGTVHKVPNTKMVLIDNPEQDRWVEVVHQANMDNDVRMTLKTELIRDCNKLIDDYGVDLKLSKKSSRIFLTSFAWRAFMEVIRHIKQRIIPRKWD